MSIVRRTAVTAAMIAALATAGATTAAAAPFGSLGAGPDIAITKATGPGTNPCSVLVTNEGESDATGVTVHAVPYGPQDVGTLAPGETKSVTQFDCGIFEYIFYFATANGDFNLSNNYLLVKVS